MYFNNILKAKWFFFSMSRHCHERQFVVKQFIARRINNHKRTNNLSLVVLIIINELSLLINNACFSLIKISWHDHRKLFVFLQKTIYRFFNKFLTSSMSWIVFLLKRFIIIMMCWYRLSFSSHIDNDVMRSIDISMK